MKHESFPPTFYLLLLAALAAGCVSEPATQVVFQSPAWRYSGQVFYSNDAMPDAGSIHLPYILGGTCVRTPNADTLTFYQQAGFLKDMSVDDLQNLYRLEGIVWQQQGVVPPGLHVLEGGNSLVSPLSGTLAYVRIFGTLHPKYHPRSPQVAALAALIAPQLQTKFAPP